MANILLVDDRHASGKDTVNALREAGHTVHWIQEERVGPCKDQLRKKLREEHWDVLVLDIQLGPEMYGGIWVHNHAVDSELRARWGHTIIYTKHSGTNVLGSSFGSSEFPIRVFADTAGIPFDNVIQSTKDGRQPLVQKIEQLLADKSPRRCRECGGQNTQT